MTQKEECIVHQITNPELAPHERVRKFLECVAEKQGLGPEEITDHTLFQLNNPEDFFVQLALHTSVAFRIEDHSKTLYTLDEIIKLGSY